MEFAGSVRSAPAVSVPPPTTPSQHVEVAQETSSEFMLGLREDTVLYIGCGEDLVPLYLLPESDFIFVDSLNFLGSDCRLGPATGSKLLFSALEGLRDFQIHEQSGRAWRPLGNGRRQTVQFLHEAWAPSWCPDWLPSVRAMYFCGWAPVTGMEPVVDWSTLTAEQRKAFFERNFRSWALKVNLQVGRIYACNSPWVHDYAQACGATLVEVPFYQFLITPAAWRPRQGGTWGSLKFGSAFRAHSLLAEELVFAFQRRGVTLRECADEEEASSAGSASSSSLGPKPATMATCDGPGEITSPR